MIWTIVSYVIAYTIGVVVGLKGNKTETILCPYRHRWQLEGWAKDHYPETPPSYFSKRDKTYLISLWYTRPGQDCLPIKSYNKE